jgi:DNA-binding MarR family transcriptional regulator
VANENLSRRFLHSTPNRQHRIPKVAQGRTSLALFRIYVYTSNMTSDAFTPCIDCMCYWLRRAARVTTRNFDRHFKKSKLQATQFTVLAILMGQKDIGVTELSDWLVIERTGLLRNLRVLETRGLIDIRPGKDRRQRRLSLTRRGRAAAIEALPLWRKAQEEALRLLPRDSRQSFLSMVQALG